MRKTGKRRPAPSGTCRSGQCRRGLRLPLGVSLLLALGAGAFPRGSSGVEVSEMSDKSWHGPVLFESLQRACGRLCLLFFGWAGFVLHLCQWRLRGAFQLGLPQLGLPFDAGGSGTVPPSPASPWPASSCCCSASGTCTWVRSPRSACEKMNMERTEKKQTWILVLSCARQGDASSVPCAYPVTMINCFQLSEGHFVLVQVPNSAFSDVTNVKVPRQKLHLGNSEGC